MTVPTDHCFGDIASWGSRQFGS